MTQPRTYKFSDGLFDKIKEFKPELKISELERMVQHQKNVISGLKAFQTKLIRTLNNN